MEITTCILTNGWRYALAVIFVTKKNYSNQWMALCINCDFRHSYAYRHPLVRIMICNKLLILVISIHACLIHWFHCVDAYVPVDIFSVMSERVPFFVGWTSTKQMIECLVLIHIRNKGEIGTIRLV